MGEEHKRVVSSLEHCLGMGQHDRDVLEVGVGLRCEALLLQPAALLHAVCVLLV